MKRRPIDPRHPAWGSRTVGVFQPLVYVDLAGNVEVLWDDSFLHALDVETGEQVDLGTGYEPHALVLDGILGRPPTPDDGGLTQTRRLVKAMRRSRRKETPRG